MTRTKPWAIALVCLAVGGLAGCFLNGTLPWTFAQNPAVVKEPNSYRDVAKKVLPAVVSIEVRAKPAAKAKDPIQRRRTPFDDMPLPEEFRKQLEEFHQFQGPEDSVPHQGFGSGFIVDPKGVILTNNHVVAGADQVQVTLADGRKFTSKEVKGDQKTDLAIVRIDAKDLPCLELGDSDAMEIGDRVLAAGAPFGLTGSITAGIVSAKGRKGVSLNMYEDFIQTDAAINPGNSGGPLVNLEGKVIAINAAIKTRNGGFQGVGLAVASNLAKNVMQQLLTTGVVRRGYLGIQIRDLTDPDVAARLGVKENGGVLIAQVYDKAPAAKAGLQAGDVITTIGGKAIKDGRELQQTVANLPIGKPVDVIVVRDGKSQTIAVTIDEQPEEFGTTARVPFQRGSPREPNTVSIDKVGIDVADLTPPLADQLGYKEGTAGVVVMRVEPGSIAEATQLRRGTLIVKVDREPVESAAKLKDKLEKAALDKGVLLQIQSPQGGTGFVLLQTTK